MVSNGLDITSQALTNFYGSPNDTVSLDYITAKFTLTSPASWSSGNYRANLRVFFYEDDNDDGNYNTLVSSADYPVIFWAVGETSTTKTGVKDIPLKLFDKKYKLRVRVVGGNAIQGVSDAGYTFTGIDCEVFMYGRVDQS